MLKMLETLDEWAEYAVQDLMAADEFLKVAVNGDIAFGGAEGS